MKKRDLKRGRKVIDSAPIVPSHEEMRTFVIRRLAESHSGLSARERQQRSRFTKVERTTGKANIDKYPDLARAVSAPGVEALGPERSEMFQSEFREFLKRYEALHWQVIVGEATRRQVMWTLSHRFFLPWLALRIALASRHRPRREQVDWFIPISDGRLCSSVQKLVDRLFRRPKESYAKLALRLQSLKPSDPALPKVSLVAKREEDAVRLQENLSKHFHFKSSPPMEFLELLAASKKRASQFRQMLVLGRFIDRCVVDALLLFEEPEVLRLVEFFALCLSHFKSVLKMVRQEIRTNRLQVTSTGDGVPAEPVWLGLHAMPFMGNSPGQQGRFYSLLEDYMNELPREINAELRRTVQSRQLSLLPRDHGELNSSDWQIPDHAAIPEEIAGAPRRTTVREAVEVSRKIYSGKKLDLSGAEQARLKFEFLGLRGFITKAQGGDAFCSDEETELAEAECKRLFLLIHKRVSQADRLRIAVNLLKYLTEPYRPKAQEDGRLARELLKSVGKFLRRSKLNGAAHYFRGCVQTLAGNHNSALQSLKVARSLGRESCGIFWMDVLRAGLVTAERAGKRVERKRFAKLARLFGLFSKDPTPRTHMMKEPMLEQAFLRADKSAFRPFPPKRNAPRQHQTSHLMWKGGSA